MKPKPKSINVHARALGKLAAGRPKNYSAAERQKRAERMKSVVQPSRWKTKQQQQNTL